MQRPRAGRGCAPVEASGSGCDPGGSGEKRGSKRARRALFGRAARERPDAFDDGCGDARRRILSGGGRVDADKLKCSDRNALDSIAVDARLVAIKFYYDGFIHGLTDRDRQACYEARALNDDRQAIVNKTLDLIEQNCLPIETAARIAAEGACP
jgi:hypothetical protein